MSAIQMTDVSPRKQGVTPYQKQGATLYRDIELINRP